jgi:hypothetical protein
MDSNAVLKREAGDFFKCSPLDRWRTRAMAACRLPEFVLYIKYLKSATISLTSFIAVSYTSSISQHA